MDYNSIGSSNSRTNNNRKNILGVICMSLVFILISSLLIFREVHKSKVCTEKVEAVIVDNIRHTKRKKGKTKVTYQTVYDYEYEGLYYSEKSDTKSSYKIHSTGEHVTIYVDPANPSEFYDPKNKGSIVLIVIFLGVGILLPVIEIKRRTKSRDNNFIQN
ncbi:MAG: DUF3592 domain-containing protein [Ruminococcus sp.]|nr:DUF3592 domain-containing protein [Ruminococcus sp.]